MSRPWSRMSWAAVALALLVAPALGSQLCSYVCVFVVGVDCHGCPSWCNGKNGPGKVVKDTCTGIIVQTGGAIVKNQSGCSASFCNLGLPVADPWCCTSHCSTSDKTTISKPCLCYSLGCSTAVYNPCYFN